MACNFDKEKVKGFAKKFKSGGCAEKMVIKLTEFILPIMVVIAVVCILIFSLFVSINLILNGAIISGIISLIVIPIASMISLTISFYIIFVLKDMKNSLRIIANIPEDSSCCGGSKCDVTEKAPAKTSTKKSVAPKE